MSPRQRKTRTKRNRRPQGREWPPYARLFPLHKPPPGTLVITAIRPTRRDPTLHAVKIGRKRVALLDETGVHALRLEPGVPWTEELATAAHHVELVVQAKRQAVKLLKVRARTRVELLQRLGRAGVAPEIALEAVSRLEALGLVDDEALATRFVQRSRLERILGIGLIRARLMKRGIQRPVADAALHESRPHAHERERALRLVRLESGLHERHDTTKRVRVPARERRRILALLARRGFDETTAFDAVETALGPAIEDSASAGEMS